MPTVPRLARHTEHRAALPGELRVEHDRDRPATRFDAELIDELDELADELRRARRANDESPVIGDVGNDLRQAGPHRTGLPAVVPVNRADRHERQRRRRDRILAPAGELEATAVEVRLDELGEGRTALVVGGKIHALLNGYHDCIYREIVPAIRALGCTPGP